MTFFCPNCWKEMASAQQACFRCGAKVSSWGEQAYTVKLVQALSHPEPDTRMRAIYLLGETRTHSAIEALTQVYRNTADPFVKAEVIKAVGKIGGESALLLLLEALRHPSFIVRQEAEKVLTKYPRNDSAKPGPGDRAG
jgi:HEAT repeat protein